MVLACKAYVTASEDPLKGSEREKEHFTKSVRDIYEQPLLFAKNDDGVSYGERFSEAI